MRKTNWRLVIIILAVVFYVGMELMTGRSNDPVATMQIVGQVSGCVGAIGLVMAIFGVIAGARPDGRAVIRHLLIIAFGFRLAGMLLAVASITTLVDVAGTWFENPAVAAS